MLILADITIADLPPFERQTLCRTPAHTTGMGARRSAISGQPSGWVMQELEGLGLVESEWIYGSWYYYRTPLGDEWVQSLG